MKQVLFAASLCLGLACAGLAHAEHWSTPVNGTVSAVMMQSGGVMMKVRLPQTEFQAISRDMRANDTACVIKEIDPGAADTMILVCGAAGSTAP